MKKETVFFSLGFAFLVGSIGYFELFSNIQNSSKPKNKVQLAQLLVDPKKVSNQCCYCADGTVYSYATDCITGTNTCTSNACPTAPEGCGGGDD
ncbi:MAG: hypothetical protein ACKVU0_13670 [Saprospiraceae bacterium]